MKRSSEYYPNGLFFKERFNSPDKTLIILTGNIRGGEKAWNSLYDNLIIPNNADLALLIGDSGSVKSSLLERAKYVWKVKEYDDWGDYLDLLAGNNDWREIARNSGGLWGGVKKDGETWKGSGAIVLGMRKDLKNKMEKNKLFDKYDKFILTRPDQYYECRLDLSSMDVTNSVWIPTGEDYGGVCDRWVLTNGKDMRTWLSVIDDVLENPVKYKDRLPGNPETHLLNFVKEQKLKIRRFPRVMFLVRTSEDATRWQEGKEKLGHHDLIIKYSREYEDSVKNCQ